MVAIAGGGALGTLARYGVERAVVADAVGFPWATLSVNVVGSFLLGLTVTSVVRRWPDDRWLRPLVAVGFCGGFTTFSTFTLEIDQRVRHGHGGTAVAYLLVSLAAGLAAAYLGSTLGRGRRPAAIVGTDLPDPDLLTGDERPPGTGGTAGAPP
jgi:CrcB protein